MAEVNKYILIPLKLEQGQQSHNPSEVNTSLTSIVKLLYQVYSHESTESHQFR